MTENLLQELADKRELDELISRQAMAQDEHDWPTFRACLADGEVHYDFTDHTHRVVGNHIGVETTADSWVSKVRAVMNGFDGSQHVISNLLHQVKGARAESRCFVLADHFLNNETGDRSITMAGIYSFGSDRTDQGWKIQRWHLKILWYRGNPSIYQLAQRRAQAAA